MEGHGMKLTAIAASLLLFLALAAAPARCEPTVSDVRIDLGISDPAPPEPMRQKIVFSAGQVGIKALKGKTLSQAEDIKPELTPLMEKIFSQLLAGYKVNSVDITVGEETVIALAISPEGPFIEAVDAVTSFKGGVHSSWEQLLAPETALIGGSLSKSFSSVPVASAPWAAKILAGMIPGLVPLEQYFPGFETELSMDFAQRATLRISLNPKGETIRLTSLKIRSNTIPAMALERLKYDTAARTDLLIGLPVQFVQAKKDAITDELNSYMAQNPLSRKLFLTLITKIQVGRTSRISIIAESTQYSGFVRGKVNLGKEERNPDIEAHAGYFIIPRLELFTEFNFFPGPIELQANIGVGYKINPKVYAAAGRNFIDGINRIWLYTYLSEDVILSWEKGVVEEKRKSIEGSITFKAHEFYSFSLTTDFRTDMWVGIIANL